ncbi:uncharacterized protein C12orf60 homolog [Anas platyrhynchos]|nr:uncharacterized protein LOC101793456 [Anas platyrhynchos]|eukprot:XP_005012204.2 uncharacterized protein LOC101793456 [Anas platyrhynchos]
MLACLGLQSDKERIVKACENLYGLVYIYVSSTNTIFEILNHYLGTELPILAVKENFSIKENLQLLISALKDMKATMGYDENGSVSPSFYSRIAEPFNTLQENVATVKGLYNNYKGVVGSMVCAFVGVMLQRDNFPETVEAAVHQLLSSPALSLHVSELLLDYADIAKMLQQNEPPTTTASGSASGETSQQLRFRSLPSSSLIFIRTLLRGQRTIKKSLKTAAEYLEEACRVLRPPCEAFHTFVKILDSCIPAIAENLQAP